ncbi:LbetaH domain-containing protein [Clostridium prolinivorans]|uniref:hypothetical protein n=1 Tax=Clostridium prolinivorans TaxID=2769420 RepID=UPI000FD72E9D|nr:hypothetical protein [Clostridium prolinivorans]
MKVTIIQINEVRVECIEIFTCYVGSGVIILYGVTIGEGSVIAARTLVTEDVPKYSKIYDNRDKVITKR